MLYYMLVTFLCNIYSSSIQLPFYDYVSHGLSLEILKKQSLSMLVNDVLRFRT